MVEFLIGIDGGGTSCRAAVADMAGRVLGIGRSGAANIMTSPEVSLANIEKSARAAFSDAGLDPDLIPDCGAFLGLAGNNVEDAVAAVLPRLPFRKSIIESDGLIALQGALGDGDGAVAILGTGSIFICRVGETVRYFGGWGFIVGDHGSGARIGRRAFEESLLAYDGIVPSSDLTESILAEFGYLPPRIVAFSKTAKPSDFGRYAPRVFDLADLGDQTALRILREAAAQTDAALDRVGEFTGGGRLCLLGGLSGVYSAYLAERHRSRLVPAMADALTGAISLARKSFVEGLFDG